MSTSLTPSLRLLRYRLWMALGRHSHTLSLLRIYEARLSDGVEVVDDDTDIVIEGFPRSANTFAVAAFRSAQRRPVRIAHHIHGPAQLRIAVDKGIPAVMLIRAPREAISSLLVRVPYVPPSSALRDYIRFYDPLRSIRDDVVIAPFERVISGFDEIIRQVNRRWNRGFELFDPSPENVKRCFSLVEEMDRMDGRRDGGDLDQVRETTVGRPSPERDRMKARIKERIEGPPLNLLLDEATRTYRYFVQHEEEAQP